MYRPFEAITYLTRHKKLEITMEDESPDAFLIEAMSPVYEKCGSIKDGPHSPLIAHFTLLSGSR